MRSAMLARVVNRIAGFPRAACIKAHRRVSGKARQGYCLSWRRCHAGPPFRLAAGRAARTAAVGINHVNDLRRIVAGDLRTNQFVGIACPGFIMDAGQERVSCCRQVC